MAKIGIAVLGLGRMGMVHMKNVMQSPRASLKWIVRNDVKEAQRFVDTFSLPTRVTSPDNLDPVLEDPSVGAVIIASPSTEHAHQIQACLGANKAVFCEKPVTPDIESTGSCYDLAEKNNVPLFCAFQRRYDPSFRQMHDHIRSETFGQLRLLKGSSHDVSTPPPDYIRTSGGIFFDSTIHDLDLSLWMVGSKPSSIYACGNAFDPEVRKLGDLDLVNVTIKYENGVVSMIDNGRVSGAGYDQRLEAKFDQGDLTVRNTSVNQLHSATSAPPMSPGFIGRYDEAYHLELKHFLDVMEGKTELEVTKHDTLSAMKLARACRESHEKGAPVLLQ
ncbi:uncharacterized oxidoreductase YrbE-like [Haliotis rufescens]|uniref:uncharacterized oxidoreductase YrbE-like n=1 Tax=Haliotis rufescens TaxID=6454 RepID=UPI00201F3C03|nr:uncharacterized oxidoreductase YrbE-like [Haliotis rufescens]